MIKSESYNNSDDTKNTSNRMFNVIVSRILHTELPKKPATFMLLAFVSVLSDAAKS